MTKRSTHGGPGRGQGRHPIYEKPMKRVNVTLDSATWHKAMLIGKGNISAGIRRALAAITVRDTPAG